MTHRAYGENKHSVYCTVGPLGSKNGIYGRLFLKPANNCYVIQITSLVNWSLVCNYRAVAELEEKSCISI